MYGPDTPDNPEGSAARALLQLCNGAPRLTRWDALLLLQLLTLRRNRDAATHTLCTAALALMPTETLVGGPCSAASSRC